MGMLDLYGIKEVADVVFWDTETGNPVLYLDTLKVSTIEETADQTEARGGKGNPPLIIWDYGKEITLTLEDALFSMKSLSIMHNSTGRVDTTVSQVQRGGKLTTDANGSAPSSIAALNPTYYTEQGVETSELVANTTYLYKFMQTIPSGEGEQITVTSQDFPGTYRITGDTYARSQKTGKDEFFQFEVPLAKVSPEQTITMQADGDPSTFSMTVRVMRPDDGQMMRLTKYPMLSSDANQFNNPETGDGGESSTPTYTYTEVTPESGDNPSEKGWYELSGETYVLSQDTTVESGKTYYTRN